MLRRAADAAIIDATTSRCRFDAAGDTLRAAILRAYADYRHCLIRCHAMLMPPIFRRR